MHIDKDTEKCGYQILSRLGIGAKWHMYGL